VREEEGPVRTFVNTNEMKMFEPRDDWAHVRCEGRERARAYLCNHE